MEMSVWITPGRKCPEETTLERQRPKQTSPWFKLIYHVTSVCSSSEIITWLRAPLYPATPPQFGQIWTKRTMTNIDTSTKCIKQYKIGDKLNEWNARALFGQTYLVLKSLQVMGMMVSLGFVLWFCILYISPPKRILHPNKSSNSKIWDQGALGKASPRRDLHNSWLRSWIPD